MRAPRARAASHSSSTTKPAPSPSRKPLRVASNGRLARSGVSLSVDTRRQQAEAREADRADHRVEAAGEHAVDVAAADQLQRRADRLPARRARRVHRRRVAADAEAARQQREPVGRLAAAERERIVGRGVGQQPARHRARRRQREWRMDCREIVEVDAHHAGADRASPALAVFRRRARCPRRATPPRRPRARTRCERLANLRSLRCASISVVVEALDLGGDARREAARVEQRDRRAAASARRAAPPTSSRRRCRPASRARCR